MSESGIMHVIVRGIGRQLIFEDISDYRYYLKKLKEYSLETNVKICAFCLMENHVHLLTKSELNELTLFMKKLGVSYSYYFNQKYERTGHLFQDRYLSEPVDNWNYFLTVYRYILQNPQKAGICKLSQYQWSSYRYYDSCPEYMDFSLIKKVLDTKEKYTSFIGSENDTQCLEYIDSKKAERHTDSWAMEKMKNCLGIKTGTELQKYEKDTRNAALKKLFKAGITIRQIERLTGISKSTVERVVTR